MNDGELKKLCKNKGIYVTTAMKQLFVILDAQPVLPTKAVIEQIMAKPDFDFRGGFPLPPNAINLEGKSQVERDDIVAALLVGHAGAIS